jgi:hypothetical protein
VKESVTRLKSVSVRRADVDFEIFDTEKRRFPELKQGSRRTDTISMLIVTTSYVYMLGLAVAGVVLTLYIMRRRVRLGRRQPKF